MTPSVVCRDLIKAWEGVEDGDKRKPGLQPYLDPVGIWTIGHGHAIVDPRTKSFVRGQSGRARAYELFPALSMAEAEELFERDLDKHFRELDIAGTQGQIDAITSMAFNVGARGVKRSTLVRLHNRGVKPRMDSLDKSEIDLLATKSRAKVTPQTIEEGFCSWSFSNSQWFLGLFRRRLCEFLVYRGTPLNEALAIARAYR